MGTLPRGSLNNSTARVALGLARDRHSTHRQASRTTGVRGLRTIHGALQRLEAAGLIIQHPGTAGARTTNFAIVDGPWHRKDRS